MTMAATLAAAPAMAAMLTLGVAGGVSAAPAVAGSGVTNIPVLSYHQLDNGCAKTDALCDPAGSPAAQALSRMSKSQLAGADGLSGAAPAPGTDINSLSQTQFGAELAWLKAQGYHSVTAAQYLSWDTGKAVTLPSKPILITVDDGIENFYADGTSVLQKYGFTAVAFVVTQFADGATAGAQPYVGWDATWKQLAALPRATWSFAFHAGAQGHSVTYPDNPGCTYAYPCQLPTETAAQYEARVSGEVGAGRLELNQYLPVNDNFWAVPWNAIGQPSQPVSGTDPPVWLAPWAANVFKVVFVQDPGRSDVSHERYRLEIHGDMSPADFESNLLGNAANGFFNK
jgi:Polysaccharide deacetylase